MNNVYLILKEIKEIIFYANRIESFSKIRNEIKNNENYFEMFEKIHLKIFVINYFT